MIRFDRYIRNVYNYPARYKLEKRWFWLYIVLLQKIHVPRRSVYSQKWNEGWIWYPVFMPSVNRYITRLYGKYMDWL